MSQPCLCRMRNLSLFILSLELAPFCSSLWRHVEGLWWSLWSSFALKWMACTWLGPFLSHVEGICDSSQFVLHFISPLVLHVGGCLTSLFELPSRSWIHKSLYPVPGLFLWETPTFTLTFGGRGMWYSLWVPGKKFSSIETQCFWKLISWFWSLHFDSGS